MASEIGVIDDEADCGEVGEIELSEGDDMEVIGGEQLEDIAEASDLILGKDGELDDG